MLFYYREKIVGVSDFFLTNCYILCFNLYLVKILIPQISDHESFFLLPLILKVKFTKEGCLAIRGKKFRGKKLSSSK